MQAAPASETRFEQTRPYPSGMARKLQRPRPKQGARLAALRRAGPVGKARKLFEAVSTLPRRQQERIVETVSALVAQYKRSA